MTQGSCIALFLLCCLLFFLDFHFLHPAHDFLRHVIREDHKNRFSVVCQPFNFKTNEFGLNRISRRRLIQIAIV